MARNCEKKLIGLNRMYIKDHQEEEKIKNPKRPPLCTLHSSQEVKMWIPSIKKELDYYLEQLSGARQHQYPDRKIKEFEEKVAFLEKEYKRFVNKTFELDPSTTGIPWQPRGYVSKRKASDMKVTYNERLNSSDDLVKPKKISTTLMDNEIKERDLKKESVNQGTVVQGLISNAKGNPRKNGLVNLDYGSSSDEDL